MTGARSLLVVAILSLLAMGTLQSRAYSQSTGAAGADAASPPAAAASEPTAAATTGTGAPTAATPKAVPASPVWFWLGAIFLAALLAFFLGYLVPYTNIVRDQGPDPGPSTYKTYSLSRCQMALWFFVVLGSYLLIYLSTSNTTFSTTALWLMGISFGTTAAAKMVDSGKVVTAQAQQTALAPQLTDAKARMQTLRAVPNKAPAEEIQMTTAQAQIVDLQKQLNEAQKTALPQPSQSFVPDILTDDGGTSLHRFQMVVWTIVVAAIFLREVWVAKQMPELSPQLLALLGISNGAYVGLKIPEKS
jgi:hypothetical protein